MQEELRLAFAALATAGVVSSAHAISLGDLQVQSALGERLEARVRVTAAPGETVDASCFSVLPEVPQGLTGVPGLQVALEPGGQALRLTSRAPVREPAAALALRASCGGNEAVREYVLLLDPLPAGTSAVVRARRGETLDSLARAMVAAPGPRREYLVAMRSANPSLAGLGDRQPLDEGTTVVLPDLRPAVRAGAKAGASPSAASGRSGTPRATGASQRGASAAGEAPPAAAPARAAPSASPSPKPARADSAAPPRAAIPANAAPSNRPLAPASAPHEPKPAAASKRAGGGGFALKLSSSEVNLEPTRQVNDAQRQQLRERLLVLDADDQVAALLAMRHSLKQLESRVAELQLKLAAMPESFPTRATPSTAAPPKVAQAASPTAQKSAASEAPKAATAAPMPPVTEAPKLPVSEAPKPAPAEASKPAAAEVPKPPLAEAPRPAVAEAPKPAPTDAPKASGLPKGVETPSAAASTPTPPAQAAPGTTATPSASPASGEATSGTSPANERRAARPVPAKPAGSAWYLALPGWVWYAVGALVLLLAWLVLRLRRPRPDESFASTDLRGPTTETRAREAAAEPPAPEEYVSPQVSPPRHALASDAVLATRLSDNSGDLRRRYVEERFPEVINGTISLDDPDSVVKGARLFYEDGNMPRAVELLQFAIEDHPAQLKPWLALFEIFRLERLAGEYSELAGRFMRQHGDHDAWRKVRYFGREIDPGNPLYREDAVNTLETIGPREGKRLAANLQPVDPIAENWLNAPMDFENEVLANELRNALMARARLTEQELQPNPMPALRNVEMFTVA